MHCTGCKGLVGCMRARRRRRGGGAGGGHARTGWLRHSLPHRNTQGSTYTVHLWLRSLCHPQHLPASTHRPPAATLQVVRRWWSMTRPEDIRVSRLRTQNSMPTNRCRRRLHLPRSLPFQRRMSTLPGTVPVYPLNLLFWCRVLLLARLRRLRQTSLGPLPSEQSSDLVHAQSGKLLPLRKQHQRQQNEARQTWWSLLWALRM